MTRKTKNADNGTETLTTTIDGELLSRIILLAETATVKQTPEQVVETILRQGLKVVEKRRKETQENRIEKAEQLLKAMGRLPIAS